MAAPKNDTSTEETAPAEEKIDKTPDARGHFLSQSVFYSLRPDGEYVQAEIVNAVRVKAGPKMIVEQYLDTPLDEDAYHLEIQLDRRRHNSARSWGYRLNVKEGPGIGQFLVAKPFGADHDYEERMRRKREFEDETRRRVREQAELSAGIRKTF